MQKQKRKKMMEGFELDLGQGWAAGRDITALSAQVGYLVLVDSFVTRLLCVFLKYGVVPGFCIPMFSFVSAAGNCSHFSLILCNICIVCSLVCICYNAPLVDRGGNIRIGISEQVIIMLCHRNAIMYIFIRKTVRGITR